MLPTLPPRPRSEKPKGPRQQHNNITHRRSPNPALPAAAHTRTAVARWTRRGADGMRRARHRGVQRGMAVDMSRRSGEGEETLCIPRGGIHCLCRKCSSSSRGERNGGMRSERPSGTSEGETGGSERGALLTLTRRRNAQTAIDLFFFFSRVEVGETGRRLGNDTHSIFNMFLTPAAD
jgi:hypothetical protein